VRGRTLQFHIQRHRHEFTESFIRRMFTHLLNGLREVHAKKLLHLDIKPANIYITMEGKPVLLDFGAARQALTSDAPRLRPMYTAGYAAPEQYHSLEQLGPWSDIYAVGATIYTCLTGVHPQPANEARKDDQMIPPRNWHGRIIPPSSTRLSTGAEADHLGRPQTAFELQKALMREIKEIPGEVEAVEEAVADDSLAGRLRKTLNRKIF
jgi:hypothetical protein